MNTIIWLVLLIAVWGIIAVYILPRLGFKG